MLSGSEGGEVKEKEKRRSSKSKKGEDWCAFTFTFRVASVVGETVVGLALTRVGEKNENNVDIWHVMRALRRGKSVPFRVWL
jgi:hypothetical protein